MNKMQGNNVLVAGARSCTGVPYSKEPFWTVLEFGYFEPDFERGKLCKLYIVQKYSDFNPTKYYFHKNS
jgi:hypothetical protein